MSKPLVKFVNEDEIRRLFNDIYLDKIIAKEFTKKTTYDVHVTKSIEKIPLQIIPKCSRSQMVSYFDSQGQEVVKVHRYLKRDGTLGASGKPDPKWLLHGNILYLPDRNLP